jgi:hypothetical protein
VTSQLFWRWRRTTIYEQRDEALCDDHASASARNEISAHTKQPSGKCFGRPSGTDLADQADERLLDQVVGRLGFSHGRQGERTQSAGVSVESLQDRLGANPCRSFGPSDNGLDDGTADCLHRLNDAWLIRFFHRPW